jgi:hypothetical protein
VSSVVPFTGMAMVGPEIHRDAAAHTNSWLRKSYHLLIIRVQQVVGLHP